MLVALQDEFREWIESWQRRGAIVTDFLRRARSPGDESQHQFGLAVDWGLTSNRPELIARIRDDAVARGYVAVMEPTAAGGPHLHVQRFQSGFLASCGFFPVRV